MSISEDLIVKKRDLSKLQKKKKKWYTAADLESIEKLKKEIAILEEKKAKENKEGGN